ncbi:hypothetical protein JCM11641_004106 [Rhodosporidiobolus odoratus]
MRSAVFLPTLASFASLAVAQTGYGRFPCTVVNDDGTVSPDASMCNNLTSPGSGEGLAGAGQGDTPAPAGAACKMEEETGAYFCGIDGAACTSDSQCDNGLCGTDGTCQGGFLQACAGEDNNCLGYLYCLAGDYTQTDANVCGGFGSYCQDYTQGDLTASNDVNYDTFNQFCASGYCNFGTANCDVHFTLGQDCSTDVDYGCATGLTCDQSTFTCVTAAAQPSARARSRRSAMMQLNYGRRHSVCPRPQSACAVVGGGFECVDTSSDLEQCGACANQGGVDCTALEGVESTGCIAGICEIWACAEGFGLDASSQSCRA